MNPEDVEAFERLLDLSKAMARVLRADFSSEEFQQAEEAIERMKGRREICKHRLFAGTGVNCCTICS